MLESPYVLYIKKDNWVACVWQNETKKLKTLEAQ